MSAPPTVEEMRENLRRHRARVSGAGELSTGTGALLVIALIWIAAEAANQKLR